ncbi:MAG TPA: glycosyltransferase family 39 protein, partial [Candidatus Eisenbacteria bacterium]|nr:glycosyltransferase family 39 protein [Candidatus Eisenbacteria bacterium]
MALALRIFLLGHQSLWVDEYLTWHTANVGQPLPFSDILRNDHGPLLQMVLHAWTSLVGDSEFSLRLPSALATTALVPVFAALAARVLGVGLAAPAAWMVALSPYLVWYGQEARNYAFAMLFSTLAALAAWDWHERGEARQGAWFVLWAWLGLLSNLNVGLVLPFLLAWVALPHDGRRGQWKGALVAVLALGVLEAPWAIAYSHFTLYSRLAPMSPVQPANTTIR